MNIEQTNKECRMVKVRRLCSPFSSNSSLPVYLKED